MDFRLGDHADTFRSEVRAFLDEQMTPELEEELYRSGVSNHEGLPIRAPEAVRHSLCRSADPGPFQMQGVERSRVCDAT